MKKIIMILMSIFLMSASSSSVFAHGVNVFAWMSESTLEVEGTFSSGNPTIDSTVTVFNETKDKKLLSGTTNKKGKVSFALSPTQLKEAALYIELDAGLGHKGKRILRLKNDAAKTIAKAFRVDHALESRIASLEHDVAHLKESRPIGLFEIIAGLGWIAGIAGAWAFALLWRQKNR